MVIAASFAQAEVALEVCVNPHIIKLDITVDNRRAALSVLHAPNDIRCLKDHKMAFLMT